MNKLTKCTSTILHHSILNFFIVKNKASKPVNPNHAHLQVHFCIPRITSSLNTVSPHRNVVRHQSRRKITTPPVLLNPAAFAHRRGFVHSQFGSAEPWCPVVLTQYRQTSMISRRTSPHANSYLHWKIITQHNIFSIKSSIHKFFYNLLAGLELFCKSILNLDLICLRFKHGTWQFELNHCQTSFYSRSLSPKCLPPLSVYYFLHTLPPLALLWVS